MTSSAGQTALPIDQLPSSEPESLDSLDYDDWEGQFEFVGCNGGPGPATVPPTDNGDADDLNLTAPGAYTQSSANKRPILIDEETFLSLQSSDGTTIDYGNLNYLVPPPPPPPYPFQAPQAHIIETALKHLQFDKTATAVPLAIHAADHPASMAADASHFDRILRLKNRLNNTKSNAMLQPSDTNNNHSRNNNDNKHTNRNSQSRFSECHSFGWNDEADEDDDDGGGADDIKLNGRRYSNDLCDTFVKDQVSLRWMAECECMGCNIWAGLMCCCLAACYWVPTGTIGRFSFGCHSTISRQIKGLTVVVLNSRGDGFLESSSPSIREIHESSSRMTQRSINCT